MKEPATTGLVASRRTTVGRKEWRVRLSIRRMALSTATLALATCNKGSEPAGVPPAGPHITALSTSSAIPFSLLTITGSGFDPRAHLSVRFSNNRGFVVEAPPLSVNPMSIAVFVPAFGKSGAFSPGTVSVELVESGGITSNEIDGFVIQDLPPAPSLPPGTVTLAFMTAVANLANQLLDTISRTRLGTTALANALANENALLNQLISAVQGITQGASQNLDLGSLNGTSITFGRADLTNTDRWILGVYIRLTSIPSTAPPSSNSRSAQADPSGGCQQISQQFYSDPRNAGSAAAWLLYLQSLAACTTTNTVLTYGEPVLDAVAVALLFSGADLPLAAALLASVPLHEAGYSLVIGKNLEGAIQLFDALSSLIIPIIPGGAGRLSDFLKRMLDLMLRAELLGSETPVASVTVTPRVDTVLPQGTLKLSATTKDAAGNVLTDWVVTWGTSDPAVATVDENGLVTGVAAGTSAITATSEGVSGMATVFTPPPATIHPLVGSRRNVIATVWAWWDTTNCPPCVRNSTDSATSATGNWTGNAGLQSSLTTPNFVVSETGGSDQTSQVNARSLIATVEASATMMVECGASCSSQELSDGGSTFDVEFYLDQKSSYMLTGNLASTAADSGVLCDARASGEVSLTYYLPNGSPNSILDDSLSASTSGNKSTSTPVLQSGVLEPGRYQFIIGTLARTDGGGSASSTSKGSCQAHGLLTNVVLQLTP